MPDPDQRQYFEKRAREERQAAEGAGDERVAQPHRELANRYDQVAKGEIDISGGDDGTEVMTGLSPEFRILP